MQVKFTVNITEVQDGDGDTIPTEQAHYDEFARTFGEDMGNVTHELVLDNGILLSYEMEDIDSICVACETFPCKCE